MNSQIAETNSRRLYVHLKKNEFEKCHRLLDELQQDVESSAPPTALAQLPISARLLELLENECGFIHLKDLEGIDLDELQQLTPRLGPGMITELRKALRKARKQQRAWDKQCKEQGV